MESSRGTCCGKYDSRASDLPDGMSSQRLTFAQYSWNLNKSEALENDIDREVTCLEALKHLNKWMDGLAGSSHDYQWIQLRQVTDGLTLKVPTSSLSSITLVTSQTVALFEFFTIIPERKLAFATIQSDPEHRVDMSCD
ncbi:hypothetical protein J6590_080297 [Homalodisca vitripennis]|nr:hypothetical protein J6590_080297 [Homalodisca vitripennis]